MSLPLVSVVIPTYNRSLFIERAIVSVLKQSYKNIELIVVDDGSTDNTAEIVGRYGSVIYIRQENSGVASARNRGIRAAKGEYIAFLDSDDEWLEDKLKLQIEAILGSDYKVCHTDEIWIRNGMRVNPKKKHKKYGGFIFDKCLPLCIISPSSVIIHRSVFDDIGLFDEEMIVCEDYDMWLRMCIKYEVLYIDKKLIIKYGGHSDQLSHRYWGMDRYRVKAIMKIMDMDVDNRLKRLAIAEAIKKANILANGFYKREKHKDANYYHALIKSLNNLLYKIENQ